MYKTFVGVPLNDDLWNDLAHLYPASAYKEVGGMSFLTDVNAGQVTRRLWRAFGPRGVGWGLDLPDRLMGVVTELIEGKTYATIPFAYFWYLVVTEGDTDPYANATRANIATAGSSSNKDAGYAITGAMTSCIKKAISYLGHQNALYCGAFDHKTVGTMPENVGYMKSLVDEAEKLGGEKK